VTASSDSSQMLLIHGSAKNAKITITSKEENETAVLIAYDAE
jgi:hypothetical protein